MTRVVPGARLRALSPLGALGAVLVSMGLAGCPGTLSPDLLTPPPTTCDVPALFMAKSCAGGGCHDATGFAANFDMASPGWETHLVGVSPKGQGTVPSLCSAGGVYLEATTQPAQGLFLRKLTTSPGCGVQMPQIAALGYLNATQMNCVQQWANALVMAAGSGGGGNADGGAGQ